MFWLVNRSVVASHPFRIGDEYPFPLVLSSPLEGVTIDIISVSTDSNINFNVTSVLNAVSVSTLLGTSIECEEARSSSSPLNIGGIRCELSILRILWICEFVDGTNLVEFELLS